MRYRVTIDSYVLTEHFDPLHLGPIPGTTTVAELDTDSGGGKDIWWGYLSMREEQKMSSLEVDDPYRVLEGEDESEAVKFREAINLFLRFLAGEGRDNFRRVTAMQELSK